MENSRLFIYFYGERGQQEGRILCDLVARKCGDPDKKTNPILINVAVFRKETTVHPMKSIKNIPLFVALIALLLGCATTFRPWEFNEVKEGMDRAQVVKLIGEPDRVESKEEADFLYYSYHEDYDPASGEGIQEHQARRSMKTQNYVVKLVDGKVQSTKELPPTRTL